MTELRFFFTICVSEVAKAKKPEVGAIPKPEGKKGEVTPKSEGKKSGEATPKSEGKKSGEVTPKSEGKSTVLGSKKKVNMDLTEKRKRVIKMVKEEVSVEL